MTTLTTGHNELCPQLLSQMSAVLRNRPNLCLQQSSVSLRYLVLGTALVVPISCNLYLLRKGGSTSIQLEKAGVLSISFQPRKIHTTASVVSSKHQKKQVRTSAARDWLESLRHLCLDVHTQPLSIYHTSKTRSLSGRRSRHQPRQVASCHATQNLADLAA